MKLMAPFLLKIRKFLSWSCSSSDIYLLQVTDIWYSHLYSIVKVRTHTPATPKGVGPLIVEMFDEKEDSLGRFLISFLDIVKLNHLLLCSLTQKGTLLFHLSIVTLSVCLF